MFNDFSELSNFAARFKVTKILRLQHPAITSSYPVQDIGPVNFPVMFLFITI